jgi:hypothetical protein
LLETSIREIRASKSICIIKLPEIPDCRVLDGRQKHSFQRSLSKTVLSTLCAILLTQSTKIRPRFFTQSHEDMDILVDMLTLITAIGTKRVFEQSRDPGSQLTSFLGFPQPQTYDLIVAIESSGEQNLHDVSHIQFSPSLAHS